MVGMAAVRSETNIAPAAPAPPTGTCSRKAPAPVAANSIEDLVGRTPLVRFALPGMPAAVTTLAKLEMANPLSSSKDRAALFMLRGAEHRGELVPGGTVVEATSGNTGIALAALSAIHNYRCIIVLPENATRERRQTLAAYGAEVVLSPAAAGLAGAISTGRSIAAAVPGAWFAGQTENADNVRAHFETTGPEIWEDCRGRVSALVCGVGTGGTISGIGRYLKEQDQRIAVVAVEPRGSAVLSGGTAGPHAIPGLNGGFVAPATDVGCIDEVVTVSDEEALSTARDLARTAGLLVGVSSGAVAYACRAVALRLPAGAQVVGVFPDSGERYLSAGIFDEEPSI